MPDTEVSLLSLSILIPEILSSASTPSRFVFEGKYHCVNKEQFYRVLYFGEHQTVWIKHSIFFSLNICWMIKI